MSIMFSIAVGSIFSAAAGIDISVMDMHVAPLVIGAILFAGSLVPLPSGITMMAYTMVSVRKGTNAGRTKPKNFKLIVFRISDVSSYPDRDDKGVKITGNLVLKSGAQAIEIETTATTMEFLQKSEGDPDNKGFIPELKANIPGSSLTLEEFFENNVNEDLGVIIRYCGTDLTPRLFGSLCNPVQFQVESTDNNDGDTSVVTFTQTHRGSRAAWYYGDLPTLDTGSGSGSGI